MKFAEVIKEESLEESKNAQVDNDSTENITLTAKPTNTDKEIIADKTDTLNTAKTDDNISPTDESLDISSKTDEPKEDTAATTTTSTSNDNTTAAADMEPTAKVQRNLTLFKFH